MPKPTAFGTSHWARRASDCSVWSGDVVARARHAQAGLDVDVAGDVFHHPLEALAFGRRRDDEHQVEAELVTGLPQWPRFLGGQVRHDESLDAHLGRAFDEGPGTIARSVLVDQIVVGHADQRDVHVEGFDELEEPLGRHPASSDRTTAS